MGKAIVTILNTGIKPVTIRRTDLELESLPENLKSNYTQLEEIKNNSINDETRSFTLKYQNRENILKNELRLNHLNDEEKE